VRTGIVGLCLQRSVLCAPSAVPEQSIQPRWASASIFSSGVQRVPRDHPRGGPVGAAPTRLPTCGRRCHETGVWPPSSASVMSCDLARTCVPGHRGGLVTAAGRSLVKGGGHGLRVAADRLISAGGACCRARRTPAAPRLRTTVRWRGPMIRRRSRHSPRSVPIQRSPVGVERTLPLRCHCQLVQPARPRRHWRPESWTGASSTPPGVVGHMLGQQAVDDVGGSRQLGYQGVPLIHDHSTMDARS